MRAFRYHSTAATGGPRLEEVPAPVPGDGEVLVRVHCASLNPVDWKIAAGKFRLLVKGGLPRTMGSDFAGEVVAVGAGADGFGPGDRVWGFIDPFKRTQGTFAELCPVPSDYLFALPDDLTYRDAAALACVGTTAVTLCDLTRTVSGSRVLVNGAAGGVGHVAVQVAKARGARVTAVASGAREEFVRALGADEFIDYRRSPVGEWPSGFDAVFDCVPNLPRRVQRRLIRSGGQYATTLPDALTFLLDPLTNAVGRVHRHGVMIGPSRRIMDELLEGFRSRQLHCHIEAEYPLERAAEAIARSRSGRVQGKLVVRVG